jgi:glycosyltransferase involved in cell wall biosynthesis
MRVLLTANASYLPPKGGSTRSNLIWLADLARRGHACRVVCSTAGPLDDDSSTVNGDGVEIFSVRDLSRRTRVLAGHIADFQADWVLVSSEDVSHVLLREAAAKAADRLVYLAHTPQWYPFGPASWHPDPQATEIVRRARAVVAIAKTTAAYIREHAGAEATVIHPPMYGEGPFPRFGSSDRGYLLLVNPCVVKGIGIFLELARRFPQHEFAGLAGWGTTTRDREAMGQLPNVRVLEPVPDIDAVLSSARLLLMPSIWFEGFGLIAMEAMLRGLPVVASNAGGLVEAKRGTDYVIPVRMIEKFEPAFDETHMPRPVQIDQDIQPWVGAMERLLGDETAYWAEADRSREVALRFVASLRVEAFEELLSRLEPGAPEETTSAAPSLTAREARSMAALTPAQKALLMKRLRERGNR